MTRSNAPPEGDTTSNAGIYALIPDSLDPETASTIAAAYENALQVLGLTGRLDPLTEIVARKIVEIAQTEERDPARIQSQAIASLGLRD